MPPRDRAARRLGGVQAYRRRMPPCWSAPRGLQARRACGAYAIEGSAAASVQARGAERGVACMSSSVDPWPAQCPLHPPRQLALAPLNTSYWRKCRRCGREGGVPLRSWGVNRRSFNGLEFSGQRRAPCIRPEAHHGRGPVPPPLEDDPPRASSGRPADGGNDALL
jgi:hypothetical protein